MRLGSSPSPARTPGRRPPWSAVLVLGVLLVPLLLAAPAEAALDLRVGSRGTTVRTVEGRLHTLGLLRRSQVDRVYRSATATSVRTFQRQKRLRVTGRVDQRTWDAVARAARPKPAAVLPALPVIAGHRGAADGPAPENTMAAMRYAAAYADVLETDVRATADGVLVLLHDPLLDRTTSCEGPVAAWTYADLSASCVVDTGTEPQPVPTLDELAAYVATTTLSLAPELKPGLTEAQQDQAVATLQRHGVADRTYLLCYAADPGTSATRLRALEPRLRIVYLTIRTPTPATVQATGASFVALRMDAATAGTVAHLQQAGLKVWSWTAATEDELRATLATKVDGVITKIPRQAHALLHP